MTNGDRPKRRRARAETRQAIEAAAIEAATRLTAQGDLARPAAGQPPRAAASPRTAPADDAADPAANSAAQAASPASLAARAAAIQQEIMRQYRNR